MSRVNLEEFRQSVYDIVAAIPSGRVMTYGQISLFRIRSLSFRNLYGQLHYIRSDLTCQFNIFSLTV